MTGFARTLPVAPGTQQAALSAWGSAQECVSNAFHSFQTLPGVGSEVRTQQSNPEGHWEEKQSKWLVLGLREPLGTDLRTMVRKMEKQAARD